MEPRQLNTEDGFIIIDRTSIDNIEITMRDMNDDRSVTLKLDNLKFAYLKAIVDELV